MRIFLLSMLMCMCAASHAYAGCADVRNIQTHVNVNLVIEEPKYDYSKTVEGLTEYSDARDAKGKNPSRKKDMVSKIFGKLDSVTKGLTHAFFHNKIHMTFIPQKYDHYGVYYCQYFGDINITLTLSTVIYVAKEVYDDKCHFPHVLQHEKFHHVINTWEAETLREKLQRDIYEIINYMDAQDPVERGDIDLRRTTMMRAMQDVVEVYSNDFSKNQESRQNELDTPHEYERLSKIGRECRAATKAE